MSVTHLQKWDVTAFEIALDVEVPQLSNPAPFLFSGRAEPRICLVAGFALTSHLKHIIGALDRAVPERPPAGLRIAPSTTRGAGSAQPLIISLRPMHLVLRLQSKLIRAIEPGLAHDGGAISLAMARSIDEANFQYVHEFISQHALPTFEPQRSDDVFDPMELRAVGLTMYRLGRKGTPESILSHWIYPKNPRPQSLPLRSGP